MNMKTETFVSLREYLKTSYEPDCDYVDGEVQERNVGERDHSKLQGEFFFFFRQRQDHWKTFVFLEQRIQISTTRFRVPDICVYAGTEPAEQIFRTPPFICIEILSPEDRVAAMQEKVGDFLEMGVPYVWIINPRNRKAYRCTPEGMHEISELRTENPEIVVPIDVLFED